MANKVVRVKCPHCKKTHTYNIKVDDSVIFIMPRDPMPPSRERRFPWRQSSHASLRLGRERTGREFTLKVIVEEENDSSTSIQQKRDGIQRYNRFQRARMSQRGLVTSRDRLRKGSGEMVPSEFETAEAESKRITRVFICPATGKEFQAIIIIETK